MAVSSYVKNAYLVASGRDVDTAYPIVEGACWLRGVAYYVSSSPASGDPDTQSIDFHNGENLTSVLELPCGSGSTMAQFMVPDEAYMDFDEGLWFSSNNSDIIDDVYLSVFYSQ